MDMDGRMLPSCVLPTMIQSRLVRNLFERPGWQMLISKLATFKMAFAVSRSPSPRRWPWISTSMM